MIGANHHRAIASSSVRLASTYLAIIMLMSIGFSFVLYNASAQQLRRQVPPDDFFRTNTSQPALPQPKVNDFLNRRAEEGREALLLRLVALNVGALLAGSVVSYYLARRSLRPIEAAMDAQNRFVGDASHELRTPLASVQVTNEVALRDPNLTLDDAKQKLLQNIVEVEKLKELSDGLLSLAQRGHTDLKLVDIDIQDVTTEAINRVLTLALEKNITINDKVAIGCVLADQTALIQVLVILLDNAIKYSPAHSEITISSAVKSSNIVLSVVDQGIGIEPEDAVHIFERFYRADTSRTAVQSKGYGLGLAIAKTLMHQMNGSINVKSSPEKGTAFTVELTELRNYKKPFSL